MIPEIFDLGHNSSNSQIPFENSGFKFNPLKLINDHTTIRTTYSDNGEKTHYINLDDDPNSELVVVEKNGNLSLQPLSGDDWIDIYEKNVHLNAYVDKSPDGPFGLGNDVDILLMKMGRIGSEKSFPITQFWLDFDNLVENISYNTTDLGKYSWSDTHFIRPLVLGEHGIISTSIVDQLDKDLNLK